MLSGTRAAASRACLRVCEWLFFSFSGLAVAMSMPSSGQHFLHDLRAGVGQRDRPRADVVVLVRVDAQRLVDGREEVAGANLPVGDAVARRVGLAVARP